MSQPIFLDLDAVKPEIELTIKLNGETHQLVPTSVDAFIDQTEMLQKLGADVSIAQELEVVKKILTNAFPTVPMEAWGKISVVALRELNAKVMSLAEAEQAVRENPEALANPQTAAA